MSAPALFGSAAFVFETRVIHWSGELVFAMAWLVLVLSIAAVGLMYWLIRRSAATGFASLFYLVPVVTALLAYVLFGEKLDALSIVGMVVCAVGVVLVNRGAAAEAGGRQRSGVGDGRKLARNRHEIVRKSFVHRALRGSNGTRAKKFAAPVWF